MLKRISEILLVFVLLAILGVVGLPKAAVYFHNQGVGYYQRGLYKEAIASFKKALKLRPTLALTHFNLANVYMDTKRIDDAIAEYKLAIELDPKHIPAYQAFSRVYADRLLYEEAVAILKKIDNLAPQNKEIEESIKWVSLEYAADRLEKGTELFLSGEKEKAFRLMREAIKLQPDFTFAYYSMASCYFSEGNYELAEEALKTVVQLDPEFWLAYKLLGDVLFQRGLFEKALANYERALESNDKGPSVYNGLGLTLMQLERYNEALPYLKQAVALDPQNADTLYSLASVYRDSGRPIEAIKEYGKLIALKSDYPNMHNDLGDIYYNMGKKEEALREYEAEISNSRNKLLRDPNDPVARNSLAYALNGSGDSVKAKESIDKVIASNPGYRQAYLTLAKIYEKTGRLELATSALAKAKALSSETNFIDRDISRLKKDLKKMPGLK